MNDLLWDGELDCGWEDLSQKVKDISNRFSDEMLETVSYSPIDEAKELISEDSMERFVLLAHRMASEVEDGYYSQVEGLEKNVPNANKLTSWILLGSLTETALQMFLAFYIDDYKKSKWQQWENFPSNDVKTKVFAAISDLTSGGIIDNSQGKSLKEAIKDTIKEHTKEHPVQRVMLDEIIQFYRAQDLLDEDEIFWLRCIQSNRNGIHSFERRDIGTWSDLQYAVRFWCYLLEWILYRLPDIPDYY